MSKSPFTLLRRGDPLAEAGRQREILEKANGLPRFEESLNGLSPLSTTSIEVMQINVGKLCNQTCRHCHVDAGPDRKEIMSRETMAHCLRVLRETGAQTLDLTGGTADVLLDTVIIGRPRNNSKRSALRSSPTVVD